MERKFLWTLVAGLGLSLLALPAWAQQEQQQQPPQQQQAQPEAQKPAENAADNPTDNAADNATDNPTPNENEITIPEDPTKDRQSRNCMVCRVSRFHSYDTFFAKQDELEWLSAILPPMSLKK